MRLGMKERNLTSVGSLLQVKCGEIVNGCMCSRYRYRVMMWERDLRHFDIYKVDDDDVSMKLEVVKYRKVY